MFYYIVEVFYNRTNVVAKDADLIRARDLARIHSARTGLLVEVQNEVGRVLNHEIMWRE